MSTLVALSASVSLCLIATLLDIGALTDEMAVQLCRVEWNTSHFPEFNIFALTATKHYHELCAL
jgi:hypothetical protein